MCRRPSSDGRRDWGGLIRMAGAAGITPAQFWRLTPWELRLYLEGVAQRRDSDMEALAWLQANIMNLWSKTRVRASQLFRRRDAAPEFADAASFNAYMRARTDGEE